MTEWGTVSGDVARALISAYAEAIDQENGGRARRNGMRDILTRAPEDQEPEDWEWLRNSDAL